MNREDVIRIAKEVWGDDSGKPWHESALVHLEAFAKLVATAEREACAKVCYDKSWELKNEAMKSESKTKGVRLNDCAIVLYDAHKAIRARGQQ